jgi:hypothetical protein
MDQEQARARLETATHTTNAQTAADIADLERLGAVVARLGLQATVRTAGRLPYLDVRNPRAGRLAEAVYVQGSSYWWSWAERIASREDATATAAILARVLRTVGEEPAQ